MKTLNITDADRALPWHVVRDVNQWVVLFGSLDAAAKIGAFYSKARCKEFLNLNKIKATVHGVDAWLSDRS